VKIHEFLSTYFDEVCEACVQNLTRAAHDRSEEELTRHVGIFIDQVVQRLRHAAGLPEATGLPEPRETAASIGHEVYSKGLGIESAARSFAILSVTLGEVGGRYHLAFEADEYRFFNQAIDDSVAVAIEQFTKDAHAEYEHAASERVGFLAHELRNAIASAKLAFGALERTHVGDGAERVAVVRRSLRRMERLVEQTLVDVRLSEAAPPPLRPLLVSPLLREVEADCVVERGIHVAVATDDSLAVVADEHLLTVALGNLVQNAIKCSRDGALIEIRARREPDAVVVEIEDECGGLPSGAAEELFKPFVQQRADLRGLGLGLAITRRAAHSLSAEVTVRDLPGKGCVFAMRLRPTGEGLQTAQGLRRAESAQQSVPATRS